MSPETPELVVVPANESTNVDMLIVKWFDARNGQPQTFGLMTYATIFQDAVQTAPKEATIWFVGERKELRKTPQGDEGYIITSGLGSDNAYIIAGTANCKRFLFDLAVPTDERGPIAPRTYYKFVDEKVFINPDGTVCNQHIRR